MESMHEREKALLVILGANVGLTVFQFSNRGENTIEEQFSAVNDMVEAL